MKIVENAISSQVRIEEIRYWSDSKTVLFWINNRCDWKQFVCHSINEILSVSEKNQWGHCPGTENPADLGSHGTSPFTLDQSELWWKGPACLRLGEKCWPKSILLEHSEVVNSEAKKVANVNIVLSEESFIKVERFSSLHKLPRITAWIQRFMHNMTARVHNLQWKSGNLK